MGHIFCQEGVGWTANELPLTANTQGQTAMCIYELFVALGHTQE
jgi:hypothetical protein